MLVLGALSIGYTPIRRDGPDGNTVTTVVQLQGFPSAGIIYIYIHIYIYIYIYINIYIYFF